MPDATTYSIEDLEQGERASVAYADAARALAKLHGEHAKALVGVERRVALALVEAHKLMALGADALAAHYRKAVASCR